MEVLIGILIPFIGTIIGSLLVYIMKKELNRKVEVIIYGFAAGVMMAALIWSLIIPAIESAGVVPVVIGLMLGVGIFYLIDLFVNKKNEKLNNLMVAVTLHNIPEGMAVGVAFASYLVGGLSLAAAYALAIGIATFRKPRQVGCRRYLLSAAE